MLRFGLALAAAPSPCPAGQTVVTSCRAEKRILALCADGAKKPQFLIADGLAALCFKSQWHDQAADCFAANQKKCDEKLIGGHVMQAMEVARKISPDE